MSVPPRPLLTLQQRRVRLMLATFPMIVVTGYVLYKRLVLGEAQKRFSRPSDSAAVPGVQRAKMETEKPKEG
ncbi:uncharacterized protein C8R40DRAFT_1121911 [Lentinula edodes]|uniref:uncharacterized protein n=1 Tax=Lentinula edodes TaxID=5353 RepID=UPI001E8E9310|nr:uncharacterized protein C8R40DRAFT_1121911 [Lentinula edodes]KAH7871441.1 hypothetical protein C8R40DRAFT_1121911 [Lentinula edodes]